MTINKIADFGKFRLVTELADGETTVDIVATSKKYTMEDQKNPGTLFTSGRMVVLSATDVEDFLSLAFSNCVANGNVDGYARYTLTIRMASDGTTPMIGLANTDSGDNSVTNVISGNLKDDDDETIFPLPAGSLCLITVGSAEYSELLAAFTNALEEISDETTLLAAQLASSLQAMEQRLNDDQAAFELDIQGQQDDFEDLITAQQDDFEEQQQQNFDNFVATQRTITGIVKDGDATKLQISGGDWLDGVVERSYAGVETSPTLGATTFFELQTGTGNLVSNGTIFTPGNFPICKVITDGAGITTVTNYGAAYQVAAAAGAFSGDITGAVYTDGLLTEFVDADSITWTLTYSGGQLATISSDGDTTTINRDSGGNFTGVTIS